MGCGVHGIATVVDSGASNIDYLIVACYSGITLFNGRYLLPELSFKVQSLWANQLFKTNNRRIQIVNDSVAQKLYIVMANRTVSFGNYANGFDPKNLRWTTWTFNALVNTLALVNVNELLLGCDQS